MQSGFIKQSLDIVVNQTTGQPLIQTGGDEGVERKPNVNVGQSMKMRHQRKATKVSIAIVMPLVSPYIIRYQVTI